MWSECDVCLVCVTGPGRRPAAATHKGGGSGRHPLFFFMVAPRGRPPKGKEWSDAAGGWVAKTFRRPYVFQPPSEQELDRIRRDEEAERFREERLEAERARKERLKEQEEEERQRLIAAKMPLMPCAVQHRDDHNRYCSRYQHTPPRFYFLDAESRILELPQEGEYPIPPSLSKPQPPIVRKKKKKKGAYWHRGPCVTKTGPVEADEWEYISDDDSD